MQFNRFVGNLFRAAFLSTAMSIGSVYAPGSSNYTPSVSISYADEKPSYERALELKKQGKLEEAEKVAESLKCKGLKFYGGEIELSEGQVQDIRAFHLDGWIDYLQGQVQDAIYNFKTFIEIGKGYPDLVKTDKVELERLLATTSSTTNPGNLLHYTIRHEEGSREVVVSSEAIRQIIEKRRSQYEKHNLKEQGYILPEDLPSLTCTEPVKIFLEHIDCVEKWKLYSFRNEQGQLLIGWADEIHISGDKDESRWWRQGPIDKDTDFGDVGRLFLLGRGYGSKRANSKYIELSHEGKELAKDCYEIEYKRIIYDKFVEINPAGLLDRLYKVRIIKTYPAETRTYSICEMEKVLSVEDYSFKVDTDTKPDVMRNWEIGSLSVLTGEIPYAIFQFQRHLRAPIILKGPITITPRGHDSYTSYGWNYPPLENPQDFNRKNIKRVDITIDGSLPWGKTAVFDYPEERITFDTRDFANGKHEIAMRIHRVVPNSGRKSEHLIGLLEDVIFANGSEARVTEEKQRTLDIGGSIALWKLDGVIIPAGRTFEIGSPWALLSNKSSVKAPRAEVYLDDKLVAVDEEYPFGVSMRTSREGEGVYLCPGKHEIKVVFPGAETEEKDKENWHAKFEVKEAK